MAAPNTPRRPAPARGPATRPPRRRSPVGAAFWLLCALTLAAGVALQAWFPGGFVLGDGGGAGRSVSAVSEIHASSSVQLSEVMTSNDTLLRDARGETPDWLEVYNASDAPVDLAGWTLARNTGESHIFVFPQHVLEPGACALVFADSSYAAESGGEYHAPFSLRSEGDTLMLFNPSGTAVESINIPALERDQVYRCVDGVWEVSAQYTPGLANTEENYRSMCEVVLDSDVTISRVIADNVQALQAEDGRYYDYIELSNASDAAVDISGWYLSDDAQEPMLWRIPDGTTIPAGGTLGFWASELNEGLHTNFRLAREGEVVVLANRFGQLLDLVDYDILDEDQIWEASPATAA